MSIDERYHVIPKRATFFKHFNDIMRAQTVLLELMVEAGLPIDTAANGQEAITALERQHYDVVFMDWHMPEMDGITATKKIREQWASRTEPWIIAMTANAMPDQRKTCLDAGMNDFIAKPVQSVDLAKALLGCPKIRQGLQEATTSVSSPVSTATAEQKPIATTAASLTNEILANAIDEQTWQELLNMAGSSNYGLISEMIGDYLEDSQEHIENITSAIAAQSFEELTFSAHALKGASRYLGALELSKHCHKLEQHAKAKELHHIVSIEPQLQQAYQQTITALQDKRKLLMAS